MNNQFARASTSKSRFAAAAFAIPERSLVYSSPVVRTTFNAGDIVPIYCREVLPSQSDKMSLHSIIRQTTLLTPTMGKMRATIAAFFVPNRIVNHSWKEVQGENSQSRWAADGIELAPLVNTTSGDVSVPVGSVADYYCFPTQRPIPKAVLALCNDLKFRGYVMIYNDYFRDQNYEPPVPISYLNVYQGFFDTGDRIPMDGIDNPPGVNIVGATGNGDYGKNAIHKALYSNGGNYGDSGLIPSTSRTAPTGSGIPDHFYALGKPYKANKLHDYFTSVLPSPQKGPRIMAAATGSVSNFVPVQTRLGATVSGPQAAMTFTHTDGSGIGSGISSVHLTGSQLAQGDSSSSDLNLPIYPNNLGVAPGAIIDGLGLSVDDIRMSSAIQQYYEVLARGGSRYHEIMETLFGLQVSNPFKDIPTCLAKVDFDLDLYQTAQTSPSQDGSTPQGNLAAFGYTNNERFLFETDYYEHGYLHIFCIVRHENVYSYGLSRDNFRRSTLDFYVPPLANISEQPVYTYQINAFTPDASNIFGYQEAWAEYRYDSDVVTGYMRPDLPDGETSLAVWNYADPVDSSLISADYAWLKSNSQAVLDRTLAVTSSQSPQFRAEFQFNSDRYLPLPVYSVPGLDVI
nr:MAG: major capsid protein [Microviridae sp.]